MSEDAPQREHDLREVFNAMRWMVRTGSPWWYLSNDLPPWEAVYQQSQCWLASGVFEAMTQDLRRILCVLEGRHEESSAAVFDSRTLQARPRAAGGLGTTGRSGKKGSKVHMALDTIGRLLALHVTAANEQDREEAGTLARAVQKVTGRSVELAYVDQGYTRNRPAEAAVEPEDRAVGGEAAGGETGVRAAAAAVGGGAASRG